MTEENKTQSQATEQTEAKNPVMALQKIYLKDASFEAPNAPQIFQEQGQPQIQMNLNQKVTTIAENTYDVVLTVTVTCTVNEKTAYLVEVQQAGIFSLVNFPEQLLHQTLGAYAPNVLFPFARQAIADLVMHGGFQPLLLQPVNFDQLYAEQMQRAQENAGSDTTQ